MAVVQIDEHGQPNSVLTECKFMCVTSAAGTALHNVSVCNVTVKHIEQSGEDV